MTRLFLYEREENLPSYRGFYDGKQYNQFMPLSYAVLSEDKTFPATPPSQLGGKL